jgi:large subunit ribosomal protein L7/L12
MSAIAELGEKIAGLTLAQAVELKNLLKEKYGIEPAAGAVAVAATTGPAQVEAKVESTEFNVILEAGFDAAKKIGIIKVVREITGLGLAEAKGAVEGAPKAMKENVDKKTAEDIKKKLEEAGAKVSIKGV